MQLFVLNFNTVFKTMNVRLTTVRNENQVYSPVHRLCDVEIIVPV